MWSSGQEGSEFYARRATAARFAAKEERRARVPAAAGGAGGSVDARTSIEVRVDGSGDPEVAAQRTARVVEDVMARRGREAAAILGHVVEDD